MELYITYWNASGPAELYDYSVTGLQQHKLTIDYSTTLYRSPDNFTMKKFRNKQKVPENYTGIFEILKIRKRMFVKRTKCPFDLFLVARNQDLLDNQNNHHNIQLKQGSFIKLGKTTLSVIKIKADRKKNQPRISYTEKVFEDKLYVDIEPKNKIGEEYYGDSANASTIEEAPCCRYCYQKSIEQKNLLTMLCKCEGTTKYVHEECLKSWILQRSRYTEVKQGVYRADKEGLKCQICKFEISLQEILPCFNQQNKEYLILLVENSENEKSYWIVKLCQNQDNRFIIGRKYECHISINDLSVSREHCCIKWNHQSGVLTINDMGSKFGTLVKKDIIEIKKPTIMQVGRTRFSLSVEEQQMFLIKKIKSLVSSKIERVSSILRATQ